MGDGTKRFMHSHRLFFARRVCACDPHVPCSVSMVGMRILKWHILYIGLLLSRKLIQLSSAASERIFSLLINENLYIEASVMLHN